MHDAPLRADDDVFFHFDQFAATFARLTADVETRTPLTVGISGAWGAGKTTLLRRIKRMLDSGEGFFNPKESDDFRQCKTVWFDAWKYTEGDELLVALIRVILTAMMGDGFKNRLNAWWEDPTQPSYEMAEMFVNAFQFKFGGLGFQVDPAKHKKESHFETHTAFFDYFDEAFETLLARWVHGKSNYTKIDESKGALVIFIDDLDRCLPKQAIQTLEAVKLFLDKRGCVFFLGADIKRLQSAVTAHYQDTGVLDDSPDEYLEKVIQLRFNLPPIAHDKMDIFVKEQISAESPLYQHWKTVVAGAEANPRKVKTFLNDIMLRWAIWQNTGEADRIDYDIFVSWEILMRSSSKFRERLFKIRPVSSDDYDLVRSLLENAFKWAGGEGEKADEAAAASFKEDLNDQMRRVLREIRPFRERFSPQVLDQLLHLTALPVDEELVTVKEADTLPETEKDHLRGKGVALQGSTRRAEYIEASKAEVKFTFAEMPFQRVPKGGFLMGSKKGVGDDDEQPQHTLDLPYDYFMARFSLTNEVFARFVQVTNYETQAEKDGKSYIWELGYEEVKGANWKYPLGPDKVSIKERLQHPVVHISWRDAYNYIAWLNENYAENLPDGYQFTLPSEAEWEKAARGEYANEYPWGNDFDKNKCNSSEGGIGTTSPVGQFSPAGDSPYGCADMVGNTWEWTRSLWKEYPYPEEMEERRKREDENASGRRVLRGGSFDYNQNYARCAYRNSYYSDEHSFSIGFRICVSPVS